MFKNILTPNQLDLLPLIREFSKGYYLVGGTAIALQIGHRRSVDFDLFTQDKIKKNSLKRVIENYHYRASQILFEDSEQLHLVVHDVKITFFSYPYRIEASVTFDKSIKMPDLLSLAAMKAYALGGRAKWKDYVDLHVLLKDHFSLAQISGKARDIFGAYYNEKLFREQLCYFGDIDYSETVDFVARPVPEEEIRQFLTGIATTSFS